MPSVVVSVTVNAVVGSLTYIYSSTLGITQEIHVSSNLDFLDAQTLVNATRQAEATAIGVAFPKIIDASGKDQLAASVQTGITVQLLENWRIYTLKDVGTFTIGNGNIIKVDGSSPFVENPAVTYIQNLSAASTVVESGGGSGTGSTAAEIWSYTNRSLSSAGNSAIATAVNAALTDDFATTHSVVLDIQAAIGLIPTNPLLATTPAVGQVNLLYGLMGLNAATPVTVTPTGTTFGAVAIDITVNEGTNTVTTQRTA